MDAWLDRSSVKSITTPLGRVQGVKSGDTYRYTLPYAQAPIGNLRFKVCPHQALQGQTRH